MQVTEKIVFPRKRFTQLLHFHDFADISQRSFVVSRCSFSMNIFADTSHMQTNFGCKPRYVKSYRGLMNPSIKKQSCRNEAEKQLVFARRTETENMAVGEKNQAEEEAYRRFHVYFRLAFSWPGFFLSGTRTFWVRSPARRISSKVWSSTKLLRQSEVAYLMAPACDEQPPAPTRQLTSTDPSNFVN